MSSLKFGLLENDLQEILLKHERQFRMFSGLDVMILGGTGFLGSWLAKSLMYANNELNLGMKIRINSRRLPEGDFTSDVQRTSNVFFVTKDLRFLTYEDVSSVDLFFFAATASDGTATNFEWQLSTTLGFSNLLSIVGKESLNRSAQRAKFVNLSSGAVYGKRKLSIDKALSEIEGLSFQDDLSEYGKCKAYSEKLLHQFLQNSQVDGRNLRLFSLFGPGVPLDRHFAIGNFILDAYLGRDIRVTGNPKTKRNYIYPTDAISAIISGSLQHKFYDLNVGSSRTTELIQVAQLIANQFSVDTSYKNQSNPPNFYYPDITRLHESCGLSDYVTLEDGIQRWMNWLRLLK